MNRPNGVEEPRWRRFLTPWKIAAVLLAAFLITQGYLWWRSRFIVEVMNDFPAFATPGFKLEFSSKIQYDPLTFVGRGARAGFWKWTPQRLVLTESGRRYFRMEGDKIVSQMTAGRRQLSGLREQSTQGDRIRINFYYRWEELSPPTVALLYPPPKLGEDYLGSAVLVRLGEKWEVTSLETRDFDEPLEHLQSIASGVRQ